MITKYCEHCGKKMYRTYTGRKDNMQKYVFDCDCGSSCTTHLERGRRTEHWFIQTDDGMKYLKVETNKKEQK